MRPGWCAIEITPAQHEGFGAYLFVEDDGSVLRYCIDSERVRIGRDESNDIWIDNPAVRPHTLLVYVKDQEHCIKVYDGAKVSLNGVPVTGMHRLYSGDRIGIADREFLYGRDDTPAECAVGLTVVVDGCLSHAVVFRRTRIRIGRRDADLILNDAAVSDRHLQLECYGADGVYALDLGSTAGTIVRGKRLDDARVRLTDGSVITLGRIELRVHLLPSDAHGLLLAQALPAQPKVPLAAPAPMDRSAGQRHDPSAQGPRRRVADTYPVSSGFIRPLHQANASRPSTPMPEAMPVSTEPRPTAVVPVTEIGSLQQILQRAHQQKAADLLAQRPPVEPAARSQAPEPQQVDQHRPLDSRPAVRLKPELMEQSQVVPAGGLTRRPQWDASASMVPVSASPTAMHEQRTDMLDTDAIRARANGKASWLDEAEAHFDRRPEGAQLTQALDLSAEEGRYRPSSDRPQTWVGRPEEPAPPAARRFNERPRLSKAVMSESEQAANPGLHRDHPDLLDNLDGPVQDRRADPSSRLVSSRIIDRSRRLDSDKD